MAFGITTTGFNKKTLADIQAETEADLRAELGANIQLDDRDPLAQIKGILDERESILWDALEDIYNNLANVNGASGVPLDNLVALNGITRLPATKSTVVVTVTGTPAVTVPAGFTVSVAGEPTARFVNPAPVVIPGGGSVDIEFESESAGAVAAPIASLTVIETPTAGIDSTTNAGQAVLGSEVETDAELKLRRANDLEAADGCSDPGIRDAILSRVAGVSDAFVVSNRSILPDLEGRPPKSFEAFVLGGDDAEIAAVIFDVQPAGIESTGDITEIVDDDEGTDHTIKFSRIDNQRIIAEITITPRTDNSEGPIYAVNGDDQVKDALVAYFLTLGGGSDIVNSATYTPINTVDGVIGIVAKFAKFGDPLTTANISIPRNKIPTLDLIDIVVIS